VTYIGVASDNAMAHLVRDLVGTENVKRHLAALGLRDTTLQGSELATTAFDMALLLSALTRGYPSPFVSEGAQRILLEQWVRDRIPSGIDDPAAEVANKTGDWEGAAHDAAIVRSALGSYSLVVLTDGTLPNEFFAGVARAVHGYLSATSTAAPPQEPTGG
jgi:beta-lactamase class A